MALMMGWKVVCEGDSNKYVSCVLGWREGKIEVQEKELRNERLTKEVGVDKYC